MNIIKKLIVLSLGLIFTIKFNLAYSQSEFTSPSPSIISVLENKFTFSSLNRGLYEHMNFLGQTFCEDFNQLIFNGDEKETPKILMGGSGECQFTSEFFGLARTFRPHLCEEQKTEDLDSAELEMRSKKIDFNKKFSIFRKSLHQLNSQKPFCKAPLFTEITFWLPHKIEQDLLEKTEQKVKIIKLKLFSQISQTELLDSHLCQNEENNKHYDLIIDMFGILTYDPDLYSVLNRYLDLLKPNGAIYYTGYRYTKKFFTKDGILIDLVDFLQSIKGIEVQVTNIMNQDKPFEMISLKIKKTSHDKIVMSPFKASPVDLTMLEPSTLLKIFKAQFIVEQILSPKENVHRQTTSVFTID
jgi:hypothetical protein